MVVLIAGASHTGKTALAQRLLEQHGWPYLSMDHLKMGLIRSGQTRLTPESDDGALTAYLWPIVREMVKTAIENRQNLVVEGCYIPFDWREGLDEAYLREIRYCCLIMTRRYVEEHRVEIQRYANVVEARGWDFEADEAFLRENEENLAACRRRGLGYVLLDREYRVEIDSMLEPPDR